MMIKTPLCIHQVRIMAEFAKDSPDGWSHLNPAGRIALKEIVAEIEQQQARIEQLETALKPFVEAANKVDDNPPDLLCEGSMAIGLAIHDEDQPTVGDLRRAAIALMPSAK